MTRPSSRSRAPRRARLLDLAHEFYLPAAIDEAVRAFRDICTLRLEHGRDGTTVRSDDATERDLLEFANYALARSVTMRRTIASESTKSG